jgi:hypothetical protein
VRIDKHLAESFDLSDRAALLDDVRHRRGLVAPGGPLAPVRNTYRFDPAGRHDPSR